MTVYPDFYDAFCCTAERCRHTCCRGWEIDIDADTAARYRAMEGPLGERLRAAIDWSDGASFRLTEDERCPFLRADNLCDLIRETGGEDILCDVCALHPRFFTEAGETTFAGLGLCCEEACRLLLQSREPLRFLAEDRALTLAQLTGGLFAPDALHFEPRTDAAVLEAYARCEPIDARWTAALDALRADIPGCVRAMEAYLQSYDSAVFDRILHCILYRQLDRAEQNAASVARYAQDAAQFVFLTAAVTGDLPEALRRWSEQTEYSTENVGILTE